MVSNEEELASSFTREIAGTQLMTRHYYESREPMRFPIRSVSVAYQPRAIPALVTCQDTHNVISKLATGGIAADIEVDFWTVPRCRISKCRAAGRRWPPARRAQASDADPSDTSHAGPYQFRQASGCSSASTELLSQLIQVYERSEWLTLRWVRDTRR